MIGGRRLAVLRIGFEHLQARLIAVDERHGEHVLGHQVDQRHQMRGTQADHPPGHGRTSQVDTEPRELPLLPVQRGVIDELGGGDVRKERSGRQALREQAQRRRGDLDALMAAATGVLGADMLQDPYLCGYIVELLGRFLADLLECFAVAVRAHLLIFGEVVHDLDAWQMGGQLLAATLPAGVSRDPDRLGGRIRRGSERLDLVEQPSLIGTHVLNGALLARAAEELAFEPAVLLFQELDARAQGGDIDRLGGVDWGGARHRLHERHDTKD